MKFYPRKANPHWNGKTIATLDCCGKEVTDSNNIHELAHWFVASPDRRKEPNFGLGPSPEDPWRTPWSWPGPWADEEEALASCVGIVIESRLGMDWHTTAKEHGWEDPRDIAKKLRKARIRVKKDGVPQRIG